MNNNLYLELFLNGHLVREKKDGGVKKCTKKKEQRKKTMHKSNLFLDLLMYKQNY